ncbi:flavin reductase [Paenarthrobacter sp. RAF54_2]|uniref:flavin reductase n=1 Tax=Paenarthrobacter sp. RAF54_2 TaxID=3233061 RepID=UPI003F9706E5
MGNEAPAIAGDLFRNVLGHYPTGVSIVTADVAGNGPVGMVVGTFNSLSLDPPLVSFMPAKSSTSWPKIQSSGFFCVNVLGASQGELSRQFSARDGKKFEGADWRPAPTGSPILSGVTAWVDCKIEQVFDSGDHEIVVGRVIDLNVESDELPMTFLRGRFGQVHLPDPSPGNGAGATAADDSSAKLAEEVAELLGLNAFEARAWSETREQVIERLLVGFLEVLLKRFDERIEDSSSADQQLQSLIRASLDSLRDYAAAAIMFQSERASLTLGASKRLKGLEEDFRNRWTAVIQRGTSSGVFYEADARMAQQFICDSLFSIARWFRDGGRLERSEVEDAFTTFALNVVRPSDLPRTQ